MLSRLALRNLWRNRRRTLLTLSAMVLSTALLILCLGVFSGMLVDMLATATEQYHGHLVISRSGYQDDHQMYRTFAADNSLATVLKGAAVRGASPRLRGYGLFSAGPESTPAEVLGVDPAREAGVTRLQQSLVAGRSLQPGEVNGVVLGEGLARRLKVQPGAELVFVTQAADGSIGNDLLYVRGLFKTGDAVYDNGLALVPLPWLQQLLVLPGQLHEVALRIADPLAAAALAETLQPLLADDLLISDWGSLLPEMRELVASYDVSRLIIVIILYLATALGVLNTFFMAVMERTREFGMLMAIGMRPGQIRRMVLLETFFLGVLALLFGVALGLLLDGYMAWVGIDLSASLTSITYAGGTILPRLRAVVVAADLYIPALCLLLVCLLAGFLPANRAARMKPVVAMRQE